MLNFALAGNPNSGKTTLFNALTGSTAQTLSLHADVGAKLTDAQKAAASAKNWTLAY